MAASISDQGFIINSVRFGEGDKFLKVLTINHGLVDLISKGSNKPTSRKAPHLDLLNLIKFQTGRGASHRYLSQVEARQVFPNIKSNLPLTRTAFYVCELLNYLLPNNQVDYTVFNLVSQFLNSLENNADVRSTTIEFQLNLIDHLGFQRPIDESPPSLVRYFENLLDRKIRSANFKIS